MKGRKKSLSGGALLVQHRVRLDWAYCCWNWKLKTENWKYYSKIIFKCVNSIVGLIFNIFNTWTVHKQYMNSESMWGYCLRAEKKKKKKHKRRKRNFNFNPDAHKESMGKYCKSRPQSQRQRQRRYWLKRQL